jgi:hypothetical protein
MVGLAGLSSLSSAYQQLARLRRAGLAEVRRVDPGYLVGERRLGCWSITDFGSRMLARTSVHTAGVQRADAQGKRGPAGSRKRARIRDSDVPLLIAAYRLLASLVLDRGAGELTFQVLAWEWPWIREVRSTTDRELLRLQMPAGTILRARKSGMRPNHLIEKVTEVVLLPDLGTAPVVRHREMLRRLVAFSETAGLVAGSVGADLQLVIATPDADGTGARIGAWLELLDRIGRRHGDHSLRVRVLSWDWVSDALTQARSPQFRGRDGCPGGAHKSVTAHYASRWPAPARSHEQLLHLIGRHPCLTVQQVSDLLGTAARRIRRLETDLIEEGSLKRIEFDDLPRGGSLVAHEKFSALGLVEITGVGRRRLAGWLGLDQAAATRYQGLSGTGRHDAGRRWRLLRALAHTVGANAVFVAFAVGAEALRRAGGDDELAEWRSAAACERRRCKPDGYGCYVRNGVPHGFFLEYDRGTESTRTYAAKFRAYYSYRDSRQADRDYNGFPTLLFVTTRPLAEERIGDAANRAWFLRGSEPLAVLITTTSRITSDRQGILGRIWQRPAQIGAGVDDGRQYWLTDGAPGKLVGAGSVAIPPSQLAWSTSGSPPKTRLRSLTNAAETPEFRVGPPPFKKTTDSPGVGRRELRQPEWWQQLGSSDITSLRVRRRPGDVQ